MKKPAVVRFIGNIDNYKLVCEESSFKYCKECINKEKCTKENIEYEFTLGYDYLAYFLEYWQGVRNSLHVKCNTGEIVDFIPFEDFIVINDEDNVLNYKEAIVKCISKESKDDLLEIKYGNLYKALGIKKDERTNKLAYLVMDESYDCYFYPSNYFVIIEDDYNILNESSASSDYIYCYDT